MRLPMKPSQTPETTAVLPMRRASDSTVASTSGRVFFARTTSSSFMMLAGLKKCMPSTSPGRFVNAAIRSTSSVEVLVARIAPRFITLSSALEDRLLDGEVLEHGLDDQVRLRSRGIVERRRDEPGALRSIIGLQSSLRDRAFVLLADAGDAAVQRFLFRFENGHGNADIREIHGDAAAHGAGADRPRRRKSSAVGSCR